MIKYILIWFVAIGLTATLTSCSAVEVKESVSKIEVAVETKQQLEMEIKKLWNLIDGMQVKYDNLSARDEVLSGTYDRLLNDYRTLKGNTITLVEKHQKLFERYTKLMETFQQIVELNEESKNVLKTATEENIELKRQIFRLQRENSVLKNQDR